MTGPTVLPPARVAWAALRQFRRVRDDLNLATPPGTPAPRLAEVFRYIAAVDLLLKGLAEECDRD